MYLIDLIYQRKRSSGFLGKTHKVEDSGQGTFLIHNIVSQVHSSINDAGVLTPPDCRCPVSSCSFSLSRNLTKMSIAHLS